jgi:glycosyltransferase involved in cell wall biosynthesis
VVENLPVPLDRRVWQEARALRDRGYDVTVICPRMRGYDRPEEDLEGIKILRHWIGAEASGLFGFLAEYATALAGETRLAWKAWRRRRFDVVHLCNPPDLLFLVAWPFRLLGARVVYDVHDLWPEMFEAKFARRGPLYWLVRLAERLTYACADVVLATNQSVRAVALGRGRKSEADVYVVRTAPALEPTALPALDQTLRRGRRYLVGYVGVMGNADGVDYLLDAAAHLIEGGRRDIQFLLMGTGPEHARLVDQRDRLGLSEFVDMPGRVSDETLFAALRTMDLGVSCDPINPYNHHCTMNKVLEYMAFGKAQVMFDLREGRESAADAARYVGANSAAELARAVADLLDDEPERDRMGRSGRERLDRQLSWSRSIVELHRAYDRALARRPAASDERGASR